VTYYDDDSCDAGSMSWTEIDLARERDRASHSTDDAHESGYDDESSDAGGEHERDRDRPRSRERSRCFAVE